jgi:hypothetical protein
MEAIEEAELGKLHEIFDELVAGLDELSAQHPSYVSPPQSIEPRWMDILFGVGMLVVMSVVRGPPNRAFLRRCGSEKRQHKLEPTARLIASVREVSVIDPCNGEHPHDIEDKAHGNRCPAYSDPQDPDAS